jgi:DNA polymerase III delta prime subunit
VVESGAVVAKLTIRSKPGGLIVNLADIYVTTATLPPHILIHGQEGVGKTTLAAAFPKSIFLQTEDGCPSGLEIATFGLLTTYQGVLAVLGALATEPHHYRTFVLDSLDPLEAIIWSDVCKANGWASIESPGYGKGYVAADTWWLDLLAGLDYLRRERGMMIVLLAHSAIETVNDPRAASYTSYQLRLHKRARGRVQDWADAIGFLAPDLHVQTEDAGFGKKLLALMGVPNDGFTGKGVRASSPRTAMACPPRCRSPKNSNTARSCRSSRRCRRIPSAANQNNQQKEP